MQISSISAGAANALTETLKSTQSVTGNVEQVGKTFEEMLAGLNESQVSSDNLVSQLAAGENVDLHQVMIGLEENDVNFRVALAIRDKLVDAYHEVMRMQV